MLQIVHSLFSMPVVYRPHPFFSIIATAHAQALCWKGSSSHKTAECCNTVLLYSGYRARGVMSTPAGPGGRTAFCMPLVVVFPK